jgi:Zn finger protein HypA/HybF involved in hydrogenase expression
VRTLAPFPGAHLGVEDVLVREHVAVGRRKSRRVTLECNACGRTSPGTATYTIMKLAEESDQERALLNHTETNCQHCHSWDVKILGT